jgi:predicted Fe-S protein YdhL (DUF1289 family)
LLNKVGFAIAWEGLDTERHWRRVSLEQAFILTEVPLQHGEGPDHTLLQKAERQGIASGAHSGIRHRHILPVALVTRNPSQIKIRSDQLTYHILLGLLDGKRYTWQATRGLAEYQQRLPKERGYVSLTLSPRSEEPWECVLTSLDLLGDELVDTFLVLLAVALDTYGPRHITAPFTITADDILTICQKKKSKGSYSARQRLHVIEQVRTLLRFSVCATLACKDGKQWRIEYPLIEILKDKPSEEHIICPGHTHWCLKIGNWASMIPEQQSQITMMTRQLLRYHARQQKYEKRLGRYLTMLYRVNAHRYEGRVKVSMGVLLEHAGISLDHDNPGRTREAIESAFHQLYNDGVIGPFAPCAEHSPQGRAIQERIEQHAYHWWDDYRRQLWRFDPPQQSLERI